MLVTLSGMVMFVRPVHIRKANAPMLVTLSGMVMLVSPVQPSKAPQRILPPVTVTDFNDDGM